MANIVWDNTNNRTCESGVDHVTIYIGTDGYGNYNTASPWNGVISITESDSLDDNEKYKLTIEADNCPEDFEYCCGNTTLDGKIWLGQQRRRTFAMSYRTLIGNGEGQGYKLHLIYGCNVASMTKKMHSDIGDNTETTVFSWDINTTPVNASGFKPTSHLVIDATKLNDVEFHNLGSFEDIMYDAGILLSPDRVLQLLK